MTRVHDMGGRFGDGPVIPDPEGEVFHDDWHGRALALTLAAGALGQWNLDISRHARERLGPDYNRFSYYEKWIAATADLLAKMAAGIADDLATTLLLATDKPVMVVPSMNVRMWEHAATKRNVATLRADGTTVMHRLMRGYGEADIAAVAAYLTAPEEG